VKFLQNAKNSSKYIKQRLFNDKKLSLDVLNDLGKMATLNQFQNLISEWAFQECGINLSQSWNLQYWPLISAPPPKNFYNKIFYKAVQYVL